MGHSEYIIVCPKCSKKLDVGRELRQARLRCKNCQAEFVGSTGSGGKPQPVMRAAPVERQAPAANDPMAALGQAARSEPVEAEPGSVRERRMVPKKSPVPAIVICAIGLIGLCVAVYVMMDKASSRPQTDTAGGVGDTKPVAVAPRAAYGASDGGYGLPVTGGAAAGAMQQEAETSLARILSCDPVDASKAATVVFTGEYENVSKQVLKHVRIEVDIVDESGRKQTLTSEPYHWIPSYRKGLWSAQCALPASSKVKVVATRSYYSPDPDTNLIGWAMKLPTLKPRVDGETLLKLNVGGTLPNPVPVPLTQLRVVIDFFRESGIYVGSAPGTIVGNVSVIPPNGSVEFVASFDVAEMQNAEEITVGKARFVGRKASR
jgi:hypothetical protein